MRYSFAHEKVSLPLAWVRPCGRGQFRIDDAEGSDGTRPKERCGVGTSQGSVAGGDGVANASDTYPLGGHGTRKGCGKKEEDWR